MSNAALLYQNCNKRGVQRGYDWGECEIEINSNPSLSFACCATEDLASEFVATKIV